MVFVTSAAVIHVLGAVVETMSAEGMAGLGVFSDIGGFVVGHCINTTLVGGLWIS